MYIKNEKIVDIYCLTHNGKLNWSSTNWWRQHTARLLASNAILHWPILWKVHFMSNLVQCTDAEFLYIVVRKSYAGSSNNILDAVRRRKICVRWRDYAGILAVRSRYQFVEGHFSFPSCVKQYMSTILYYY